jgi:hypothetical protein
VKHLSDWHDLDPADSATYPNVAQKVQARFRNGETKESHSSKFFPAVGFLYNTDHRVAIHQRLGYRLAG